MKNKKLAAWLIYAIAFVIVIFGLIAAPGCTKTQTREDRMEKLVQEGKVIDIPNPTLAGYRYISVRHFEYDGHKYILFGSGYGQTIVHDPDCACYSN